MPVNKTKSEELKIKKITKAPVRLTAAKVVKTKVESGSVVKKTAKVKADVLDLKGKVVESIELSGEIFGVKVNKDLLHQAVRVYLANKRRGTHSTKTRGEVQGSTKKIYRQKGTGGARHGSKRAPIFVKGGIVFGPKPRDYSLKLPTKMRRAALFSSLTVKKEDGAVKILTGLEKIEAKTKKMVDVIKNLSLDGKNRKVLLITPDPKASYDNVFKAGRNIEGVTVVSATLLNAYDVLNSKALVFMKPALETMEKTFLGKDK